MSDIACCSIMRLDKHSMGKLWDLMVMIYKWQLNLTNETHIFDITCRHIRGICKLNPEADVARLTNNTIDIFRKVWLKLSPKQIIRLRESLIDWLRPYRVKVTLLLRLGLQNLDGSFLINPSIEKYGSILCNLGSNIYIDYDYIQPIRNDDESESIDSSNERGDFLDLKALVDELLGSCEIKNSNLPTIDLNFQQNLKSDESRLEMEHKFESKADDMNQLHQIYGEMSMEEKNPIRGETSSFQQQLLDMLESDEE